jgi:hypothetical protein
MQVDFAGVVCVSNPRDPLATGAAGSYVSIAPAEGYKAPVHGLDEGRLLQSLKLRCGSVR